MELSSRYIPVIFAVIAVMLIPLLYAASTVRRMGDLTARKYGEAFLHEASVTGRITDAMYEDLAGFVGADRGSISLEVERKIWEPASEGGFYGNEVVIHSETTSDSEIRELLFEGPGEVKLRKHDRLHLVMTRGKVKSFLGETVREE